MSIDSEATTSGGLKTPHTVPKATARRDGPQTLQNVHMSDLEQTHTRVRLTFPPGPATDPVIYEVIQRFGVVPNIRRAAIHDHSGWMVCEFSGAQASIDAAIEYLTSIGVDVSAAEGDIVEG